MSLSKDFLTAASKPKLHKGPQWSFVDLAQRWGMSTQELQGVIRRFPGFPAKSMEQKGQWRHTASYYDLREAVKWYSGIRKQLLADIENKQKELDAMSRP